MRANLGLWVEQTDVLGLEIGHGRVDVIDLHAHVVDPAIFVLGQKPEDRALFACKSAKSMKPAKQKVARNPTKRMQEFNLCVGQLHKHSRDAMLRQWLHAST